MALDALLRLLNGTVEQPMLEFLAFLEAHALHQLHDTIAAEQAHQIILKRNKKVRRTRIALARAATAQLAVNAARFVTLGAEHVQTTNSRHALAELDVGAATRHVRGDGDGPALAGAGDDFRLLLVILGVEDGVNQTFLLEHPREHFARLDGNRADEHRTALQVQFLDFLDDRVEFFAARFIDGIVGVLANIRLVRRNGHHPEFVDVEKFRRLGFRRARHAGELGIETEIILDRNGRERLRFAFDRHAFFRFDCLMQTIAPAAARHETTRVLVHDDHLIFLNDVFHVELVKAVSLEQLRDRMNLLRLGLKIRLQLRLGLQPLARIGFGTGIHIVQQRRQIRQHERIGILRADQSAAFFREIGLVAFLVHREDQFFLLAIEIHLLLVLVELQFRAVHQAGVLRILQNFHQAFGTRLAGLHAEEQQADLFFQGFSVLDG